MSSPAAPCGASSNTAPPPAATALPEGEEFVLGGKGARHRFAVHRAVRQRSRGGEAQRTGLARLLNQPAHDRDVLRCGGLVARAALSHRVGAHRAVRDLAAVVDGQFTPADHVEVFRVGFPAPGDALRQRGTGDVLDALHQGDQPVLGTGPDWCESDPAVAGYHRCHTVIRRRFQNVVPADLAVVVSVDIDETGSDDHACRLDRLGRGPFQRSVTGAAPAHFHDHAAGDADVADEALGAGAVDDGAAENLQIEHQVSRGL